MYLQCCDMIVYLFVIVISFLRSFFVKTDGCNHAKEISKDSEIESLIRHLELYKERKETEEKLKHHIIMEKIQPQERPRNEVSISTNQSLPYTTPKFIDQKTPYLPILSTHCPNEFLPSSAAFVGTTRRHLNFLEESNINDQMQDISNPIALTPKKVDVTAYETPLDGGTTHSEVFLTPNVQISDEEVIRRGKRLKTSHIITEERRNKKRNVTDAEEEVVVNTIQSARKKQKKDGSSHVHEDEAMLD